MSCVTIFEALRNKVPHPEQGTLCGTFPPWNEAKWFKSWALANGMREARIANEEQQNVRTNSDDIQKMSWSDYFSSDDPLYYQENLATFDAMNIQRILDSEGSASQ